MSANTPIRLCLVILFLGFAPLSRVLAVPSLEDYATLPSVSHMVISPSGATIAFRKYSLEEDMALVVSLKDGKLLNKVELEGIRLNRLSFLDDDTLIIMATERKDRFLNNRTNDISSAFAFDLKAGKLHQLLIPGEEILPNQFGVGRIVGVSQDRNYVYMPAFVLKNDENKWSNGSYYSNVNSAEYVNYSLMKVNARNRKASPKVFKSGSYEVDRYLVDSRNETTVVSEYDGRKGKYELKAYSPGKMTELISETTATPEFGLLGFSPDQSSVLVASGFKIFKGVVSIDLQSGESTPVELPSGNGEFEGALQDIDQVVYGFEYSNLRNNYQFLDEAVGKRFKAIQEEHPKSNVALQSWTADWKKMIVLVTGGQTSGMFLLYEEGQPGRLLAEQQSAIDPESMNPVVEFEYKARDGWPIPCLITFPRSRVKDPQNLPTVVMPHGGPRSHDSVSFDWWAQAMASRGYLVIQPQFRGSTGFGWAHEAAGSGEWAGKVLDDLEDGIDALAKRGYVDKERVGIVGASFGGYAALASACYKADRYKCAVSVAGVSDLFEMVSDDRLEKGRNHWIVDYWETLMAGEDASKERLKSYSPAYNVDSVQCPILLLHGTMDRVVDIEQSEIMNRALKRANKEVRFVKLKDESHGLVTHDGRLAVLEETVRFLDENL